MKNLNRWLVAAVIVLLSCLSPTLDAQAPSGTTHSKGKAFATPEEATEALIKAAETFDKKAIEALFGVEGSKIISTGETGSDRELAKEFSERARKRAVSSIDPNDRDRATLVIGEDDWPFPAPLVKTKDGWSFDAKAGEQEIAYRRVGRNELDAIIICHGYVEAQHEYSLLPQSGYDVHQYAQRIVSTPGKKDGLAWQNPDGTWGGPVGKNIANAIGSGYSLKQPYRGYVFKVLKGQGPAAPLGAMNFVIRGAMIGGFALVAAPAKYRVSGIKTFIVGYDGLVYEKDLGPETFTLFKQMSLYNPDKTWTPVKE